MPPISDTHPTGPMSGLMYSMLLIVDAEIIDRDVLARGHVQLMAGQVDVSCSLNQSRPRLPEWIADSDFVV